MKLPSLLFPALLLGAIGLLPAVAVAVPAGAIPPAMPRAVISCHLIIPGPPVIAVTPGTSVTGLELFHDGTSAVLTSTGFNTEISTTNGGLGFFDGCHFWWLNIGSSANSYKPLSFGFDDEETTTWIADPGSILKSSAPDTSKFLACNESGKWVLYLQTGTDLPPYENCVETELERST